MNDDCDVPLSSVEFRGRTIRFVLRWREDRGSFVVVSDRAKPRRINEIPISRYAVLAMRVAIEKYLAATA